MNLKKLVKGILKEALLKEDFDEKKFKDAYLGDEQLEKALANDYYVDLFIKIELFIKILTSLSIPHDYLAILSSFIEDQEFCSEFVSKYWPTELKNQYENLYKIKSMLIFKKFVEILTQIIKERKTQLPPEKTLRSYMTSQRIIEIIGEVLDRLSTLEFGSFKRPEEMTYGGSVVLFLKKFGKDVDKETRQKLWNDLNKWVVQNQTTYPELRSEFMQKMLPKY